MSSTNKLVEVGNSFHSAPQNTLAVQQNAIDAYAKKIEQALELKTTIPIFLDTNVLLRGYGVTPQRRTMLYQFFEKYQNQIIITKQVNEEFIRNRSEVSKTYADLPEAQLSDLNDQLAKLAFDLAINDEEEEEEKNEATETFELNDELAQIYERFEKIDNLSAEEKQFLIKEFKVLKQELKHKKNNPNTAFPGMGDLIEKPNFPYGDYFLYHEMLQYIAEKKQDVLFLTFDVAKGDWLKNNKDPHPHYVHKTFALTQQSIFIADANHFFEQRFDTSFEAIVPTEKKENKIVIAHSALEKELSLLFNRLEKTIRRIATKFDIEATADITAKQILDDLNYDEIISDPIYYELKGIWSLRDGLQEGEIDLIRRQYTEEELNEILIIVKENLSGIGRL